MDSLLPIIMPMDPAPSPEAMAILSAISEREGSPLDTTKDPAIVLLTRRPGEAWCYTCGQGDIPLYLLRIERVSAPIMICTACRTKHVPSLR